MVKSIINKYKVKGKFFFKYDRRKQTHMQVKKS